MAQGVALSEALHCDTGDAVGSLGITGISCDRCQFYTNGRVHRAVFWTEPTITHLNPEMAAASVLEAGDVLVAVDGQLITTREGSARFSALPATGDVTLRIRRDGRVRDIAAPVTAVCPTAKAAEAPTVAGRPLPPSAPAPTAVAAAPVKSATPPPPPKQARASRPTAPVVAAEPAPPARVKGLAELAPLPPSPDAMAPRAELGFAFTCSDCQYSSKDGGTWTFPAPPVVSGVAATVGIGSSSGLREGDRIVEVNGVSITTRDGARQFADLKPGDRPRWTVERDGRRVTIVTAARAQTVVARRTETVVRADPANAPLRFAGTVGNTTVEVRGGRVNVTEAEGGSLVIIRTGDAEIRIRVPGSGDEELPPAAKKKGGR